MVDPVEMYDVRLLEFRQIGDVRAGVGNVYGEEVVSVEMVGFPDNDSFPYELPYHAQVVGQFYYGEVVAKQYLNLYQNLIRRKVTQ